MRLQRLHQNRFVDTKISLPKLIVDSPQITDEAPSRRALQHANRPNHPDAQLNSSMPRLTLVKQQKIGMEFQRQGDRFSLTTMPQWSISYMCRFPTFSHVGQEAIHSRTT